MTREGGHSARRVVHAGDITGYNVQETLTKNAVDNPNIRIIDNTIAVDLLIEDSRCVGARTLSSKNELGEIRADTTVLCTGGSGQLFSKTSNPLIATGDGVAMAYRAGAIIRDMEFYQFHPSILDHGSSPFFLISEAVRGEGGILVNSEGEAFMPRYHPLHDLAPRDVVSRAIVIEQQKGPVYIDIRERGKEYLTYRFPGIYSECMKRGFHMEKDLIPVSPAAHYLCGGIKINEYGETSLDGLLAFGEAACTGVHGANRLASNSTLECMTFTHHATEKITSSDSDFPTYICVRQIPGDINRESRRREIQDIMWTNYGIVRNQNKMKTANARLREIEKDLQSELGENLSRDAVEEHNLVTNGLLLSIAANLRSESRGTHKIDDIPHRDDQHWLKHIDIKENKVTLEDH